MSVKNGKYPDEHAVDDEEGSVDKKLKDRIIKARSRVDDTEEALFVRAELEPNVAMSWEKKVVSWGTIVKQFLRTIEPLLQNDEVSQATEYYKGKEIGEVVLTPPAADGYDFPMIGQMPPSASDDDIRRALGLPRGAEIPRPQSQTFDGLKSIIEADDVLEERWVVAVNTQGPPPDHEYVYPHAETTIPRSVYQDAVRLADQFLQQAGIGLKIDVETGDAGFEYSDILAEGPPGVETDGGDDA